MYEAFYIPAEQVSCRVAGASFPMARKPKRVCTYLLSVDKDKPPDPDIIVQHGRTVFYEDLMHDWHWTDGKFFFHSHLIPGRYQEWEDPGVWILAWFDEED